MRFAHMLGGLVEIGDVVIYGHSWGAAELRFDKAVHFFGFGCTRPNSSSHCCRSTRSLAGSRTRAGTWSRTRWEPRRRASWRQGWKSGGDCDLLGIDVGQSRVHVVVRDSRMEVP